MWELESGGQAVRVSALPLQCRASWAAASQSLSLPSVTGWEEGVPHA